MMKRVFGFFKIMLVLCVAFYLSACGKMSEPKPIEGSGYPHVYPKI
ncbi:MAG: hypothetical protein IJ830_04495 [Alphaproteobacteria bacterium]|nr:hypothetical protein [Alphaproteobacteria bacterium]